MGHVGGNQAGDWAILDVRMVGMFKWKKNETAESGFWEFNADGNSRKVFGIKMLKVRILI